MFEITRRRVELGQQIPFEPAFIGFKEGAGVVCDEPTQQFVRPLNVAQVARTVQGVKVGRDELRRVPDVVQPGSGFDQVGVVAENRGERSRLRGNTLGVCPALRKWISEKVSGHSFGPFGLAHVPRP
jgi:hypothetical protein